MNYKVAGTSFSSVSAANPTAVRQGPGSETSSLNNLSSIEHPHGPVGVLAQPAGVLFVPCPVRVALSRFFAVPRSLRGMLCLDEKRYLSQFT